MYLDSTFKTIQIVLGEAIDSDKRELTASWVDFTNPYVGLDVSSGPTDRVVLPGSSFKLTLGQVMGIFL